MSKVKSNKGSWVRSDIQLDGKTVIITGSNTGIGLETAIGMAERGAKIIMACRNMEKAEMAKQKVFEKTKSDKIFTKKIDLSSLESVRNFAREIIAEEEHLDILINNAGVMCLQLKTEDGFEMHMGTNHLGHFLLTNLLIDLIKKSSPSRIVNLASTAQSSFFVKKIYWDDINLEHRYTPFRAYAHSKLMNVMFTKELNKRLTGTGVTTYAVHPGLIKTEIDRHLSVFTRFIWTIFGALFLKSRKHGAQSTIYCAIAPEVLQHSGCFFKDCHLAEGGVNRVAKDEEQTKRLWDVSEEMVGLKTT